MRRILTNGQDEDSRKERSVLFYGFCCAFNYGGNRCGKQDGGRRTFVGLSSRLGADQSGDGI